MNAIAVQVRFAATKRLLFLPHAVKQMSRPERMITVDEVKQTVLRGKVIEDYPEDVRGHKLLDSEIGWAGPGGPRCLFAEGRLLGDHYSIRAGGGNVGF